MLQAKFVKFVCYLIVHVLYQVGSTGMIHSNIRKFDCDKLLQNLRTHKSKHNVILGSPYFLNEIAVHCNQMKQLLPADYVVMGGAPTYHRFLRSFRGLIPDECCITVYGCTEIEPISFVSTKERLEVEDASSDGHCVGKPAFKDSVKVIRILTGKRLWFLNRIPLKYLLL